MPIIKNRAIDQRWLAERLNASYINLTSVVHFIRRNVEEQRHLETDPWKPNNGVSLIIIIIIVEICKASTLRLKALNKHSITHIMYIEMEMLSAIKM